MGSGAMPSNGGQVGQTLDVQGNAFSKPPYLSQRPQVNPLANLFGNVQSNMQQQGVSNALSNAQNIYQTSPANVQQNLQQGLATFQGMTPEQRQLASTNLHNSPVFARGDFRNNPLYYGLQALGNPGMFRPPGT